MSTRKRLTGRLRAPKPGELDAVLAVIHARERADLGEADWVRGQLADDWGLSEVELDADARVVDIDGSLAGYGLVRDIGALVVIDPAYEGQGLGTRLLRWIEARQDERRRTRRQIVYGANVSGHALLAASGYQLVRSYHRMRRSLSGLAPGSAPPGGMQLRPLKLESDAASLHGVDAAAFAGNPDYEPESLLAFSEQHLRAQELDPGLSLVAIADGCVAGFALVQRRPPHAVAFVDILGVHPDRQRRGVGLSLLTAVFAAAAGAGLEAVELGVASDNPRALALYARAGMTERFRADVFEWRG